MEIIQPAFVVPTDIALKLATGELRRWGGVVRDQSGALVTHLKEVPLPDEAMQEVATGLVARLKDPKLLVIGLGAVTIVTAAAGGAYWLRRKQTPELAAPPLALPPSLQNYNTSLAHYLEAARNGELDVEVIDRLIVDLDLIKAEIDRGALLIEVTPDDEDAQALINAVADHTRRLAEANARDLTNLPEGPATDGATIIDLRPYLAAQSELFRAEA